MVLGLYPFADIAADGSPCLDAADGEELVRVERGAALALGPSAPEPPGTLFITTRRVIWLSEADKGKGYAVDFVAVLLHAVSRDPEAYPSPCIYTQIETEDGSGEESDESDSEVNGEIVLSKVTEMRIIPSDPGQLDGLFEAFSHCAGLNPDPNAESDDENGWVHGDEDMTDGSDAECEFSDVNPIGQTDEHDITHAVVEKLCCFLGKGCAEQRAFLVCILIGHLEQQLPGGNRTADAISGCYLHRHSPIASTMQSGFRNKVASIRPGSSWWHQPSYFGPGYPFEYPTGAPWMTPSVMVQNLGYCPERPTTMYTWANDFDTDYTGPTHLDLLFGS